jgi:hypothetical protein
MIPIQSTERRQCRVRLTREPQAAAQARSQVRAVIRHWKIPVDPDIAVLLASDLVTDAITHGNGETITLAIACSRCHLRIDVYEASPSPPAAVAEAADKERGHGLVLIAALSTQWGSFRTPAGKAVYFTLAFQPALRRRGNRVAPLATREAVLATREAVPATREGVGREHHPARHPH